MKKSTKKLTVAAVLCAATFVVMLVGSIFDVMDLSAAALASFAVIFAVIELGGAYPVLVWLVTSSAAMLLLPNKLPAIYFALFFGYYPILKNVFERLNKILCWVLKLMVFNAALAAVCALSAFFVGAEQEVLTVTPWLFLIGTPVFVMYDIALTKVIFSYMRVWKHKYKIKI